MSTVSVKTERLVLRAPRQEDLQACAALLGDYDVAKMLSRVPYPYDLDQGRVFLSDAVARWSDWKEADELNFHIDHEGRMIGGTSFRTLRETPKIGYWLGRPYWGKGLMSEAAGAALGWLFENTAHERVACEAMTENPGSLRVAEKLGFKRVGEVSCASLSRGASMPALRTELTREDFLNGLRSV
ncbi:GNAT family N-acetyltransferase [Roseibium aggregatum]|uniref:GNAT family N-acetyltransferase n=1 Tax=Roseibium aggregatum TaxID=187304 RepID=A0A939EA89_9HYPH|nr:GNAT family N-acetyltransferase [Roseibium aggregatum]MBN9668704.1 GNAT family N-acetyltransferase [Roseibium aggregatum]